MLVHDFIEVPLPVEDVETRLASSGDMPAWAEAAYRKGERLAVGPGTPLVAAAVEIEVGEAVRGTDSTTIPFSWKAVGASWLFPHMEAEIVLSPMAPSLTHLTFRGSYRPPLAAVGALLDRVALHRVAEATVRSFLERLREAVVALGPPRGVIFDAVRSGEGTASEGNPHDHPGPDPRM